MIETSLTILELQYFADILQYMFEAEGCSSMEMKTYPKARGWHCFVINCSHVRHKLHFISQASYIRDDRREARMAVHQKRE